MECLSGWKKLWDVANCEISGISLSWATHSYGGTVEMGDAELAAINRLMGGSNGEKS